MENEDLRRVILESPYGGKNIEDNVSYARACLKDSLLRGEAPIASHLLHTQVLDDDKQEERDMGIAAGIAWSEVADCIVFYIDLGYSPGMKEAMMNAVENGYIIESRKLYK